MTGIMLVSIEYQRLGQFFKNNLSNLFTQTRSLIAPETLFLMAPSIILLNDMEKRTNYSWLQLIPKLMQEPTESLIYLKVLPRQEYVIEIQSGFLLCKLPWKSEFFLMAPCVILLRDMKKRIDFWLLFNLKFKSWILF